MESSLAVPGTLAERTVDRLVGFPGFLRANGFATGGGDAVDVLAVAAGGRTLLHRERLRLNLKALLCGRGDEWRRFDELFDAWFLPPNRWRAPERREAELPTGSGVQPGGASAHGDGRRNDDDPDAARPRFAASPDERLTWGDFRDLNAREHLLDIEALMRRFARRIRQLRLRREARARRGQRLDLAATIRASVGTGGLPLRLAWREPRRVRPRLVLLVDTSRSMAATSFFYLRLARALAAEWPDLHTYIFHTHLSGISQALADPDPWRAQQRLQVLTRGFGGGTRIGECLAQFNREVAPRLVHARTAVIVMSDGYDTGEPELLARALAQLKRRARRIVWLNPLAGRPDWTPASAAMQAALPHLDLHAPGGDLASIEAVLPRLIDALH